MPLPACREGATTMLCLPGVLVAHIRRTVSDVRRWQVWSVKEPLRGYLVLTPVLSVVAIVLTALHTQWEARQALIFVALVSCGAIAVEATRKVKEPQGA